jgi:glycosyltransferase involved in cell wall biosynthesis
MEPVTILVPCAGAGTYVQETLQSVMRQSFGDFECLVIDNASPRNTYREVVNALADPRFRYIRFEDRLAMAANWNRCLGLGRHRLQAFIHDDDLWPANYLESQLRVLKEANVSAVLANKEYFSEPGKLFGDIEKFKEISLTEQPLRRFLLVTGNYVHMSAMVFARGRAMFWEPTSASSDCCFLDAYAFRDDVALNPGVSALIRVHPAQATKSTSERRFRFEYHVRLQTNLGAASEWHLMPALLAQYVKLRGYHSLSSVFVACHGLPLENRAAVLGLRLFCPEVLKLAGGAPLLYRIISRCPLFMRFLLSVAFQMIVALKR